MKWKWLALSILSLFLAIMLLIVATRNYHNVKKNMERKTFSQGEVDRIANQVADEVAAELWADAMLKKLETEGNEIRLEGGSILKKITVTKLASKFIVILDHLTIQMTGERIPILKVKKTVGDEVSFDFEDMSSDGTCDVGVYRNGKVEKAFSEGVEGTVNVPTYHPENRDFFQEEYLKAIKEIMGK